MNEQSSRSHFVFTLKIFGSNEVGHFSQLSVRSTVRSFTLVQIATDIIISENLEMETDTEN
jgi:hypothetical protein